MKLTIDRAALIKPLGHVQSVVERRNTIPILSNIVIRAENSHVMLVATDMDMDIVETVAATVMEPGVCTVPAQLFYDIVRKLPEGAEIELSGNEGGQIRVNAGRSISRCRRCLSKTSCAVRSGDDDRVHPIAVDLEGTH